MDNMPGLISQKYRVNLDAATKNFLITSTGNILLITDASSAGAVVTIQLAGNGNAQIGPLKVQNKEGITSPVDFDQLYLAWDAQPNEWVEITTITLTPAPTRFEYLRQGQLTISGIAAPIQIAAAQRIAVDEGDTLTTGNLAVTTSAQLLIAANPNRKSLIITNTSPTTSCYWGNIGVATGTGAQIPSASVLSTAFRGAVYLVATGGLTVTYAETA